MSVEQGIHERWGNYSALYNALALDRVYTGSVHDGEMPYVSMERTGDSSNTRTSEGTLYESVMLRFDVVSGSLDEAKGIANAVLHGFHGERGKFDYTLGKVLDMKKTNRSEAQDENNAWHIMLDYKVEAWQNRGL